MPVASKITATPGSNYRARSSTVSVRATQYVRPASCGKNVTTNDDRFAWLHIPKAGSTFGNSLLQLVVNASGCGSVSPEFQEWQDPLWAKLQPMGRWLEQYYWRKRVSFDGHDEISEDAWQAHKGHFVGFFRSPAWRSHSAYHHFPLPFHFPECRRYVSEREYSERVRGTMTMMLAGQSSGLDCQMATHRLKDFAHKGRCDQHVEPNVPLAIQRLEEGFSFVGITEAWALSICLCAHPRPRNLLCTHLRSKCRRLEPTSSLTRASGHLCGI